MSGHLVHQFQVLTTCSRFPVVRDRFAENTTLSFLLTVTEKLSVEFKTWDALTLFPRGTFSSVHMLFMLFRMRFSQFIYKLNDTDQFWFSKRKKFRENHTLYLRFANVRDRFFLLFGWCHRVAWWLEGLNAPEYKVLQPFFHSLKITNQIFFLRIKIKIIEITGRSQLWADNAFDI